MRVSEFAGIGPIYEKKLRGNGVIKAEDLRHSDIEKLAAKTGISYDTLKRWKTQATEYGFLSDIPGIGPVTEKKLLDAGIKDIHMFQESDLEKINDATGIGRTKLQRWRTEAQVLSGGFIIRARLAKTEKNSPEKNGLWCRIKEWLKG